MGAKGQFSARCLLKPGFLTTAGVQLHLWQQISSLCPGMSQQGLAGVTFPGRNGSSIIRSNPLHSIITVKKLFGDIVY